MEKILLTWWSWYIWKSLIEELIFKDYKLIKFEWDLRKPSGYTKYINNNFSKILHLWALNNRSPRISWFSLEWIIKMYQETNIDTISRLLDLSEKNNWAQILNFSTLNILNIENKIWTDIDLKQIINNWDDLDIYSVSKLLAEKELRESDLSIRLPSISWKEWNVVKNFLEKLSKKGEISINTNDYFSFIWVEDIWKLVNKFLQSWDKYFNGSIKTIDSWEKIDLHNLKKLIEFKITQDPNNTFSIIESDIDNFFKELNIVPKTIEEQIQVILNKKKWLLKF